VKSIAKSLGGEKYPTSTKKKED